MKLFRAIALTASAIVCAAGPASAQSDIGPHSRVGVAEKVSTLVVGVDVAVPVLERANVRIGFNAFTFNHDFDNDGITLAAGLRLRSFSAYFDWFALGGGFHISPGVMVYNGNEIGVVATVPAGRSFSLGDEDLFSDATNPVTGAGKISFANKIAPSLLI